MRAIHTLYYMIAVVGMAIAGFAWGQFIFGFLSIWGAVIASVLAWSSSYILLLMGMEWGMNR